MWRSTASTIGVPPGVIIGSPMIASSSAAK
jgi:hypothetical protein